MNVVEVLHTARDAGVRVARVGDAFELESERAPAVALVDAIRACTSEILALTEMADANGRAPSDDPPETGAGAPPAPDHHHGLSQEELEVVPGADRPEAVGGPELLAAFAGAVAARRYRERGELPHDWKTRVTCVG